MKKNTIRLYSIGVLFFTQIALFAQDGVGDDDDGGGLNDVDPAPAPINTNLIILVLFGLVFAFYKFYTFKKASLK
jgi:hypothetical protein